MAYGDLDQAVDIANDTEYGLSAVVSGDPAKAAEVAPKTRAGMVAVNAWGPGPGAAFGGYQRGRGWCRGRVGQDGESWVVAVDIKKKRQSGITCEDDRGRYNKSKTK